MATKTFYKVFEDSSVGPLGTEIRTDPIVPNGKVILLRKIGGCDPGIGDNIDSLWIVQWGSGGSWESVRVGSGCTEFQIETTFVGDGVKRFRFVRQNKSLVAKSIVLWAEALLYDAP